MTDRWKYTYWWCAGEGMEPAEDLFDTENDLLELTNLARDTDYESVMEDMRRRYDCELELWREHVVEYNDYEKFGKLFDRHVPWEQKARLIPADE